MALLLTTIGRERIKILGWWWSDVMMRYLHTSACPVLQGFAACMVHHREYALIPGSEDIAPSMTTESNPNPPPPHPPTHTLPYPTPISQPGP